MNIFASSQVPTTLELEQLIVANMGDITLLKEEHLLVLIPYPVDDILDDLRKKFPYLKISVHAQQRINRQIISDPIPDGRAPRALFFQR